MRTLARRLLPVLLVAALVAGGCSVFGGGDGGGGDDLQLTVYFERAVALYPESHVKVMGLDAGTILDVVPEGERVRVELVVDGDVPIPADVHAAVVPLSLIGERNVVLQPA